MHLCVPNLYLILNHVSLKHVSRKCNGFSGYSFGIQPTTILQSFYLSGSACSYINLPICCHDAIKTHQPSSFLKSSCLDLLDKLSAHLLVQDGPHSPLEHFWWQYVCCVYSQPSMKRFAIGLSILILLSNVFWFLEGIQLTLVSRIYSIQLIYLILI